MKFVKLNNITLCGSSVAGSTYDRYDSTNTYATDETVLVDMSSDGADEVTPHEEYVSIADANQDNYPPDNSDKWTLLGATNQYKSVDGYVNSQTEGSGEDIEMVVDVSNANYVGLFELYGTQLLARTLGPNMTTDPRCTADSFESSPYIPAGHYYAIPEWAGPVYQVINPTLGKLYHVVFTAWTDAGETRDVTVRIGNAIASPDITVTPEKKAYFVSCIAGDGNTRVELVFENPTDTDAYVTDIYVFEDFSKNLTTDPNCDADSWDTSHASHDAVNGWYETDGSEDAEIRKTITGLVAGDTYLFAFRAMTDSAPATVTVYLGGHSTFRQNFTIDGTWKTYYVDILAASTTLYLWIRVRTADICYFDDIYLMKYEDVTLSDTTLSAAWQQFFASNGSRTTHGYEFDFATEQYAVVKISQLSSEAKCGVIAAGPAVEIGETKYDAELGIDDYSSTITDGLGRTYFNQGDYAKTNDLDVIIDNDEIDLIHRALSLLRGIAAIYDGNNDDTNLDSIRIYGKYDDFNIVIPGPIRSLCRITTRSVI